MKRMYRLGVTAALASALLLSGCGDDDDDTSDDATAAGSEFDLVESGALTVCSDIPYPPFEVEDSDAPSGYSGFDIDIVQEIADRLELELKVADVGFEGLQSGTTLASGQCDMGASAMTITEERKANLDFSDPYYDSVQSLLVPADSGITSIDDLDGLVGVQQGTTGALYAEENLPDAATAQAFPSDGELWPALQAGSITAILQDLPVNVEHAKADPNYTIVEEFDTGEQYGFAFSKDEKTALLDAVNEQLQAMRDDGTYDELYATYFSADAS